MKRKWIIATVISHLINLARTYFVRVLMSFGAILFCPSFDEFWCDCIGYTIKQNSTLNRQNKSCSENAEKFIHYFRQMVLMYFTIHLQPFS